MRADASPITADAAPRMPTRAGWVRVHPRYRRQLARWGLADAQAFLELPGEIVSGHPNRHVVRVVLGRGRRRFMAFLKREHRIPWRSRLASAWAGFGWVSRSEREARLLHDLRRARLPAPRWLAFGADGHKQAFVLVRAVPGARDLRSFLYHSPDLPHWRRRQLARQIGQLLARVHAAGFNCPELWSKHVLIGPRLTLTLIDWQRSRRWRRVPWSVRVRDLAALHASLADELASPRDRLACLRAYLRAGQDNDSLSAWTRAVEREAAKLLRLRSVRDQRRPPLVGRSQRLRWLDGEALCVTRALWRRCRGLVPTWLATAARQTVDRPRQSECRWHGRRLVLRQFPPAGLLRRWLAWLRGRPVLSPGQREAAQIFRQERAGVRGPRLLAFGQRPDGSGFVLVQPLPGDAPDA